MNDILRDLLFGLFLGVVACALIIGVLTLWLDGD